MSVRAVVDGRVVVVSAAAASGIVDAGALFDAVVAVTLGLAAAFAFEFTLLFDRAVVVLAVVPVVVVPLVVDPLVVDADVVEAVFGTTSVSTWRSFVVDALVVDADV